MILSGEQAALRLTRLYARYGDALLQGLTKVTEQANGFVYQLTDVVYYLPFPGEEYLYFAVQATRSGHFTIRGPLMKDMYGLQRVFRPLRAEEVAEHPDADARLVTALQRLLEELANLGYIDANPR